MKYFFVILSVIVLSFQIAHSQEYIYQRGLVTLSMGVAIPAYEFGSGSGINLSSYSKVGTNIRAEAAYFYSWHIGVGVMFNYSVNPIDNRRLEEGYLKSSNAFKTASAEAGSFRDLAGLAGIVFDIPPNEYFSFTFKLMGGLRNVYKPTALISTTTVFSSVDYYESSDNETVFALLTSAGARVIVNEHFNVHIDATYIGSSIDFVYDRNRNNLNQKVHIGVLSMTCGVSYSF